MGMFGLRDRAAAAVALHNAVDIPAAVSAEDKARAKRIDVVSDTHGHLSEELLAALQGADLIIHAGDMTSTADYDELCCMAPVRAVLGNNDYYLDYGTDVQRVCEFSYEGLRFSVAHYREDLPFDRSDVAVCGHTHRAMMAQAGSCLVLNPGSASYPRGDRGPTIARLFVADGSVLAAEIVDL